MIITVLYVSLLNLVVMTLIFLKLLKNGLFLLTNKVNKWIVKRRKKLINEFGAKCRNCSRYESELWENESLEFAHIKDTGLNGMSRGRKERIYDVINNPFSYTLLCSSCHKDYDDGKDVRIK